MMRPVPLGLYRTERAREPVEPLPTLSASELANGGPIARAFLDERRLLPCRNVVLLQGDGGTGKSLLALQLAVAVATGTTWIGIHVGQGNVVYLSAEEDEWETGNRLREIADADNIDIAGQAAGLRVCSLAGQDAILAAEEARGRLKATPLLGRLVGVLEMYRPKLIVVDNLADTFGGNEISRTQAKQFVGILRNLAIRFDATVLLLGHPSVTGINSGSGTSGSTAWSNSVRARLYLKRVKEADAEPDETIRLLETMKSNYSARGQPIGLQWVAGRFVRRDPPKPFDGVTLAHLEKVQAAFAAGRYRVSDQARDWGGYAVAGILDLDVGRGLGAKERSAEQNRARSNVKQVLATWVRNRALFVIDGTDAKREPTTFYSTSEGQNDRLV